MGDIGRWAALAAGFPASIPAATVNRFCASSLTCTIQIAHAIRANELGVGLAGGVESMSRSGWAYMKGDAPFMPRGPVFLLETTWSEAGGPRKALKRAGLAPDQIDVWEVHEAYASAALAILREPSSQFDRFHISDEKLNPNAAPSRSVIRSDLPARVTC